MTNHFKIIEQEKNANKMTKDLFFNHIWPDIKTAALVAFQFLQRSFDRFCRNRKNIKTIKIAHVN